MSRPKIKPKIGIISGAGPMAGILLMEKIIQRWQSMGAWQDADFPMISLINYPFSDMLNEEIPFLRVQQELTTCMNYMNDTCQYLVIACQTLHWFLPKDQKLPNLIHLISVVKERLLGKKMVVVAASQTSAKHNVHGNILGIKCNYLKPDHSQICINKILKGEIADLSWIESAAQQQTVLLGCTEFCGRIINPNINLIDPFDCVVDKLSLLLRDPKPTRVSYLP